MSKEPAVLRRRWSPNLIGAGWVFLAAIAFTASMTLVKYLGPGYPAALQTFYRQLAGVVVLIPLILRHGRAAFATHRMGLMVFRSVATVSGFIMTFESFRLLPLAAANALSFTRILWVVPLAMVFLRERIGAARTTATLVGFAGVLLMLQPSTRDIGWPYLAALGGALMLACANVSAKSMSGDHAMLPLLVWSAVLGVIVALPPAILAWRWPTPGDFALLALMGVLGVAVQVCYLHGLKIGDTMAVVPIDYSRLVLAAATGYILFGEVPNATTMAGAAIVVAATLLIVFREQRAAQMRGDRSLGLAAESASGEDTAE